MTEYNETRHSYTRANSPNWLQRIIFLVLAATLAVLAFFFLTVALIAGVVIAAVIAVRWWWITRKLKPSATEQTFEGEYTVIEHSVTDTQASPRDRPL